ncbi:GntR family transcriptional regulator [Nonomuraea fuscirosea]|uniref:GntR family transcriptional regulator n=1 Tax=Nonomuraea fuscirosea TaxID=1291556 RepID=UPI00343A0030
MAFDPWGGVWATSLADQVYAWLRAAVQDGTLARGQKVTERELAARLGVSPTPVREALRQLIHERVVVRTGPRSLQIARYDPETLDEIAETEARLRGLVARFAARKRSQALVTSLYESLAEADTLVARLTSAQRDGTLNECAESLARVMAILARFHQRIESAAGNPVMEALLAQSRVFSRDGRLHRTIERIDSRPERFIRRYREHQALLDAIAEGDEERADHLAYTHHVTAARRRGTPRP